MGANNSIVAMVPLILTLVAASLTGQEESTFTRDELLALPRVCLAQEQIHLQLKTPVVSAEERRRWAAMMGEQDYRTFHHYCWALVFMRRGHASPASLNQTGNYRAAVMNFDFVLRNASRQFPMLPEVNLQKGLALRLLSRHGEAASEFVEALKLKPDYTPAYAALVDLYLDLGDLDNARGILEEGLRHVPDSKILASKRADLQRQEPPK
jgi:tetratricopeptide (TPR) repeat protein